MILVLFSIILINILLIILINKYTNAVTYIKTGIENIYDKLEDNRRILRDIKLYHENFKNKTNNLDNDIDKIICYIKTLIDYQKTIIIINKSIFESLNKDINNKSINNKNRKVNKSIPDIEYLKDILNNVCQIKEDLLTLGNDIHNNLIKPAQRKYIEDFNAKSQGTT